MGIFCYERTPPSAVKVTPLLCLLQVDWLKTEGFGGVMVWSVDMDDFRGNCGTGKYPLLTTLKENLSNYSVALTYEGPYENTGTLDGTSAKRDREYRYLSRFLFMNYLVKRIGCIWWII